jgi:hypothetical protein
VVKKITIHGLPITPRTKIEELAGASFCVSFQTCSKRTVDDAIRLVGEDGIVMLDNGAYTHWKAGKGKINVEAFEAWAIDIQNRCPQAIAVVPDVIGGTWQENAKLVEETGLDTDRAMAIWHTDEPIHYLLALCERFAWVGFGSTKDYPPGTPAWHARIAEVFAAIETWEAESEGATIRPRIHMMRAQAFAHQYDFDSSDSCSVALGHWRDRNAGIGVKHMAARIDDRIQASAGPESEHQVKRPLIAPALWQLANWFHAHYEIQPAQTEFTWKEAA